MGSIFFLLAFSSLLQNYLFWQKLTTNLLGPFAGKADILYMTVMIYRYCMILMVLIR